MNCENCKYLKVVELFHDEWAGTQYENECLCPYGEMSYECAKELGLEKEWREENDSKRNV